MEKNVIFNKNSRDSFIDFIKAYTIICVLLGHTIPYLKESGYWLWYGMQVPFFILIQVFHVFKKDKPQFKLGKVVIRVVLPYMIVQVGMFFALLMGGDDGFKSLINMFVRGGGVGPGSYYPWIYLQIAFLLPLLKPWFDRGSKKQKTIVALAICELLEIISSVINLPDSLYRLLAIRYLFLIYLGWIWVKEGIVINRKTLFWSILSMLTIVYLAYFYVNMEPWFYDTVWRVHRWPCYFYVSTLLSYFLYVMYRKTRHFGVIRKAIAMLSNCSYEIFLTQMAIITLLPSMYFIENDQVRFVFRFTLIWVMSIVGGYFFNKIYNRFTHNWIV